MDELGVAEVTFTIGEGELQRLGDYVEVGRRIMFQAVDADLFGERQCFEQRGALAPGAADHHLMPAPGAAHGGFEARAVFGEIGCR